VVLAALMGAIEQDESGELLHVLALQAGLLCIIEEDR
jgi:hypothetical protein